MIQSKKHILDNLFEKKGMNKKQKRLFRKIGYNLTMILWGIGQFIVFAWIINEAYKVIGFEKVIILLFLILIMTLRATLKAQKERQKW